MNIFFLHRVPNIAALYHCDKHVVKMILESGQLLATCHHEYGFPVTWKPTHKNHPSAVWVRQSRLHYDYVNALGRCLSKEFYRRYGHHHKSGQLFDGELAYAPKPMYSMPLTWQDPPQCMPDEYKQDDTVLAYQAYYRHKQSIMSMAWYKGENHFTPNFMELAHV